MIEEQAVSIFVDSPLQIYEDLAGDTVELKDLKDRKALFEAIDEFISQQKREGISLSFGFYKIEKLSFQVYNSLFFIFPYIIKYFVLISYDIIFN